MNFICRSTNALNTDLIAVSLEPPGSISVGANSSGTINQPGERDYYSFTAVANQTYTFATTVASLEGLVHVYKLPADGDFTNDFTFSGKNGVIGSRRYP